MEGAPLGLCSETLDKNTRMKTDTSTNGIGFLSLITAIFIILKLCGVIAWSWWWVFSPFWIGLVLVLWAMIAIGTILAISGVVAFFVNRKVRR